MNNFLKTTVIAGLLLAGNVFAAETLTRADQIPQLHQNRNMPRSVNA